MGLIQFSLGEGETSHSIEHKIRKATILEMARQIHYLQGDKTHYWAKYRETECTRLAVREFNYADEDH